MSLDCRRLLAICLTAFALSSIASDTAAEDVFYRVPLADLKLTEGKLSDAEAEDTDKSSNWQQRDCMSARVLLEGEGEAYVELSDRNQPSEAPGLLRTEGALVARAPAGRELTGSLYLPKDQYSGMVKLRFTVPASATVKSGDRFYRAKMAHYESLLDRDIPGTAWFRHQRRAA